MALYVLGDPHLSFGCNKPMDIFKGWTNYVQRIEKNWRQQIKPEDTIVLPGDISWAMKLDEAKKDFAFLEDLPGRKIISKGNHDYWWTTAAKMNAFFEDNGFHSLHILHNNSYLYENISICGTRGWLFMPDEPFDAKIMNREVERMRMSLQAAKTSNIIAFLHYPPLSSNSQSIEMIRLLQEYSVKCCYYGHLHGASTRFAINKEVNGITYKLASADALLFAPLKIL